MLCRFYVLVLAMPQQFAALSSYHFFEMFMVRINNLVAVCTLMILFSILTSFPAEAFTDLCGNT